MYVGTTVSDYELDTKITDQDLYKLAGCFEDYKDYLEALRLIPAEQRDVRTTHFLQESTQSAMAQALGLWKEHNPRSATFRALLDIVKRLGKSQVIENIIEYIKGNIVSSK